MKKMICLSTWFIGFFFFILSAWAYQPFPDTGQVRCYNNTTQITCPEPGQPFYGQDYQYQPRLPRSYTKLGYDGVELPDTALHVDDGGDWIMTRDNFTGLIWQIKTENTMYDAYSWTNARDVFIAELNREMFGGYSDWRLPTVKELSSLVDSGVPAEHSAPKIDEFWFPNTTHHHLYSYWTVDRDIRYISVNYYWYVDFSSGNTGTTISLGRYVYAVRSGSGPSSPSYIVDNENGTVTDPNTGLMWQKETAPGTFTWEQALAYAQNLSLSGYSDWRLPNINELHTLVDYTRSNPAVLPTLVNDTVSGFYWSSTSVASLATGALNAKGINFGGAGNVTNIRKSNARYVRLVRSGDSLLDKPSSLADVITFKANNIKLTSANIRGYVKNDGGSEITERKFEWGTSTSLVNTILSSSIVIDGNYYFVKLTDLLPDTVYYFRALAKNSHGWSQGITQSFTTSNIDQYQPFPDTGQSGCYDGSRKITCSLPDGRHYGQDVQNQPMLPRSYTKLGYDGVELPDTALHVDDGGDWIMTRDNVTGLVWQIKTEDTMYDTYSWTNARDVFIGNLNLKNFGGYSDWRLPTVKELSSIVDSGVPAEHSAPKIDEFWFPNTTHINNRPYWSEDRYIRYPNSYWNVNFITGFTGASSENYIGGRHVYAVRSGQSYPSYLVDNEDGTITDPNTGLMWQKETAPGTFTWEQALAYAQNLTLAGHSDWRLPNINELHTLADYSRGQPAVYQAFANDTVVTSDIYWSSTSVASQTTGAQNAKGVSLGDWGHVDSERKSNQRYVRAVRAGNSVPVGSLSSNIGPVGARNDGGRWRTLGTSDWKYQLYPKRIVTGIHRIEYKDIDQWITPEIKTVFVGEGESASTTGTYARSPQTGSLYVTIEPSGARADAARWRRAGTTAWRQSGQTETGVLVGQHSVEFRDIVGWNTPNNRNVTVEQDKTASTSGDYTVNNNEYQVHAVTGSPGGNVFGTGTYKHNQSVTFTAVPDQGYRFLYWTDENGLIVSRNSTFTFLAREGHTLTAHFEKVLKGLPGVMMLLLDDE